MVKFRKCATVALALGALLCWCLLGAQSVACTTPVPGSVEDVGIQTNSTTVDPTIDLLEQIYHIKRNLAAGEKHKQAPEPPSPVRPITFGFLDDRVEEDVCEKSIARATLRDLMMCNERMEKQKKLQNPASASKCDAPQPVVTIRRLDQTSNKTVPPTRQSDAKNAESRRIEKLFIRLNGT